VSSSPSQPFAAGIDVTIGLSSLNEERTIGPALDVLLEEMSTLNAELVVVAGGKDRTVDIAKNKLAERNRCCLIVDSAPRGKPAALNKLFAQMKGRIALLTDGDVLVTKGSLKSMLDAFKRESVGCASGRVVGMPNKYSSVEKVCDLMNEMMHLSRQRSYRETGSIELASGYLLGVRKDVIPTIPEDQNSDDGYLSFAVRSRGLKIAYVENAIVEISFPRSVSDFLRQKTRTRYGHMQLRSVSKDGPGRTVRREIAEFLRMSEARKLKGYGMHVSILAGVLTALAWSSAYLRFHLPWLFRKGVWQPVLSTK